MSFMISDAWAEAAPAAAQQGDPTGFLLTMGLMFVAFYFLLIRPQSKRAKEHKAMVEALSKGDEVITQGGIYGKVTGIGEEHVVVQLAENLEVKLQRTAIGTLLPKGTIKNL